jgi:hypothetical protein
MTAHERIYHGGGGSGDIRITIMTTAMIDKRDEIEGAIKSDKKIRIGTYFLMAD